MGGNKPSWWHRLLIRFRLFHKHEYIELVRYLMFTGEDHVWHKCRTCGHLTESYTLDTYYGQASAPQLQGIPLDVKLDAALQIRDGWS